MAVSNAAPISTDQWTGGLRYNASGQLLVWATGSNGPPADPVADQGLIFTRDGRLVVTSNPVVGYNGGWPLDQNGWVCMTLSGPPPPSPPGPFTFTVASEGA